MMYAHTDFAYRYAVLKMGRRGLFEYRNVQKVSFKNEDMS